MKTFLDAAQIYKTLAQVYIRGGSSKWPSSKAPYKTGNLYNRIGNLNTKSMVTKKVIKKDTRVSIDTKSVYVIGLNFAPPGAEYGKWVQWGNGTGVGAGQPRPFAKSAAEDPLMKRAIDAAVMNQVVDPILLGVKVALDREWAKLKK